MSGEWIKMRTNLWDDPRVSQLCDLTGSKEACIVGALYWLWAAADEHTESGFMPGLSLSAVDRKTGVKGLGAALVQVGWIEDAPDGITLIRFSEHNGDSAKRRSTDAKRKATDRAPKPAEDAEKPERKGFSPKQKYRIFAMDGFKCVYCGRHKDDPIPANLHKSAFALSLDHLIPFCNGGDDSDDNLVTACLPCNMSKNGRTPEEAGLVPDLSIRFRTNGGQARTDRGAREEKIREESSLAPNGACPPDGEPGAKAGYAVPDCPHEEIVSLYHECLPMLPRVEVWSDGRKGYLRQRWREVCAEQRFDRDRGIEWFRDYFGTVIRSDFLTGKAKPKNGDRPFLADLEWLVRPANFVKVIEGKYQ